MTFKCIIKYCLALTVVFVAGCEPANSKRNIIERMESISPITSRDAKIPLEELGKKHVELKWVDGKASYLLNESCKMKLIEFLRNAKYRPLDDGMFRPHILSIKCAKEYDYLEFDFFDYGIVCFWKNTKMYYLGDEEMSEIIGVIRKENLLEYETSTDP